MNTFFHYTPYRWTYGSYLRPGNFGRMISLWGNRLDLYRREMFYEDVRAQAFADRPSRLKCLFCLPSREDAALYRRYINGYEASFLYEAHTVEDGFTARNDRISYYGDAAFERDTVDGYWSGAGVETKEVNGDWILKEVLLRRGVLIGRHVLCRLNLHLASLTGLLDISSPT